MLTKFDILLQKIANWKTVLGLFVISFPIGYFIDNQMFYMLPRFDYLYSYDFETTNRLISYMQLAGELKAYITYELTFQIFFPLNTALFFVMFIYNSGFNLLPKNALVPIALIIPIVTLLVDYLENAGLIILLYSYPSKLITVAEITSGFATIKGFLWQVEEYVFIVGIAIYIFKTLRFVINKMDILKKTESADEHGDL